MIRQQSRAVRVTNELLAAFPLREIPEGTWASLDNGKISAKKLARLMQKPIMALQAQTALWSLVGDDELHKKIQKMIKGGDSAFTDVRPLVRAQLKQWLKTPSKLENPWDAETIKLVRKMTKQ